MKHTPRNVLCIMERTGRTGLNKRQLRVFRDEQLLPMLKRVPKAGTNKPEYFWSEPNIVKQVAFLHDLLKGWSVRHELFYLPLWLVEYDVPFARVRRQVLAYLGRSNASGVEADDIEELVWKLSEIVYKWSLTWKYSPRPDSTVKEYGIDNYTLIAEFMLNFFFNPQFEIDDAQLTTILTIFLEKQMTVEEGQADRQDDEGEFLRQARHILEKVHGVVSLPILHGAVEQANQEAWEQAREDYQTVIMRLCEFIQLVSRVTALPEISTWIRYNVFVKLALWSLPCILCLRQKGYGHWIEKAFRMIEEMLNDPAFQERLAHIELENTNTAVTSAHQEILTT